MVSYWGLITTIINVITPTVEITSHTESHTPLKERTLKTNK